MTAYNTPLPNEFDDENDWWSHEICNNYEANRLGVVRNIKTKNIVGYKEKHGYYRFSCTGDCCGINKKRIVHRFVYECFHGIIKDKLVVDHINNIKSDNRLKKLQLLTNRENCKKDVKPHRCEPSISVKAINVETGEIFNYESINKCSKDLDIGSARICGILSGLNKTTLSKKYNQRFTFEKLSENKPIIIKNKINIKINKIKSNNINNNRC